MIFDLCINGTWIGETFGCHVWGDGVFKIPERDVSQYEIEGRNGDIVIDNGRFKNQDVPYHIEMGGKATAENFNNLKAFLGSIMGSYVRLEDTFNPEHYRLGVLKSAVEPEVIGRMTGTRFELVFNCKPQRFLKSGEIVTEHTDYTIDIVNPTFYTSYPLLEIDATGTFIWVDGENKSFAVNNFPFSTNETVFIDCWTQQVWTSVNKTNYINNVSGTFPYFVPGYNHFLMPMGVKVTPRWWTI